MADLLSQPRLAMGEAVDIHCHCLPGVDDGPMTMAEACSLCRALVDDGIRTVIATPHQLGRYEGRNSPEAIRCAVDGLCALLQAEAIELDIRAGGDVRV